MGTLSTNDDVHGHMDKRMDFTNDNVHGHMDMEMEFTMASRTIEEAVDAYKMALRTIGRSR